MASDSEEEILIYAEFDENVKIGKYRSIHVLGVDSKTPIIQMDDTFFSGKYEIPLGTHMFFEQDSTHQNVDHIFDKTPENPLKYVCKTRKYLKMDHAYLTPKDGKEEKNLINQMDIVSEDDIEVAKFNSLQEAIEKFKNTWKPTDDPELDLDLGKDKEEIIDTDSKPNDPAPSVIDT